MPAIQIILLLSICSALFAQSEQEKQLFSFVNSERVREKLKPLLWDEELYKVALAHSRDMARAGRTSHTGSDGKEPEERVRSAGIFSSNTGENIARDLNVISAHTSLMQSLQHRENILEPEYTHSAVAIVKQKQLLYVTELFIRKISDYSLEDARDTLLRQYNFYRQDKKLAPLVYSEALSNAAQGHVEMQKKFDSLAPMLTLGSINRTYRGRTLVNVYTATDLMQIPAEVQRDIESPISKIGIGFKRVRGAICSGGCYLIVLVLA